MPRHYYVTVSDREFDPETVFYPATAHTECEIDEKYESAGAVYVGKLTKGQCAILQEEFYKLYKGKYVVGFGSDETYPPENLTSKVLLDNYAFLVDDQKRVLDIASHLAKSIRDASGRKRKNSPNESAPKSEKKKPTQNEPSPIKPAGKRMNPLEKKERIHEALKFLSKNRHLSESEILKMFKFTDKKALSREYAVKLKKAMFGKASISKEQGDHWLHNEKQKNEQN